MKLKTFKAIVSDHGEKGLDIGIQKKELASGAFEVRLLVEGEVLPVTQTKTAYKLNEEYYKYLRLFIKAYFGATTNKDICKALLETPRAEAKTCRQTGRYYLIREKGLSMYFSEGKTQAKAWENAAKKILKSKAKEPKFFLIG